MQNRERGIPMNGKKKKIIQVVVGILVIFAVPILFFQFMGGSLLNVNGPQNRIIAIVNEDLGSAKDEESIEMGKEVVTILAEDSPYEWLVMGRGAAVNGLKSNQYEAIVYIPSDFSESIMSYDEQNPEKAEFSYQVQRQKSGLRKEKVLYEIESATNRVNQKIATLYWSYISLEMDHIKKEFTTILEKETEFLGALSAYYKPESETLAAEMERQKVQMEGLQSTMTNMGGSHNSRIENAEVFGQQLGGFVSHVEQYKDFQATQKNTFLQIQDSSLAKIQVAAAAQVERYNESMLALEENNELQNDEILKLNDQLDYTERKFNELSTIRKQQVDRQVRDLLVVQAAAIDRYNDTIIGDLEKRIEASKEAPTVLGLVSSDKLQDQGRLNTLKEEMERKVSEQSSLSVPEFMEEQETIDDILSALSLLKERAVETNSNSGPESESEPESPSLTELEEYMAELVALKESMSGKEKIWSELATGAKNDYQKASSDFGEFYGKYKSLQDQYESVHQILKSYSADTARLLFEIKEREASLLAHGKLTDDQRKRLEELFNKGAGSTETDKLLTYYATLEQFEFSLDEQQQSAYKDELLKDDIMQALVENAVAIAGDEIDGWGILEYSIQETQLGMNELSPTFAAIMSGYEETIDVQHAALLNELDAIAHQANTLVTQIQIEEPYATIGEGEVIAGQQNVSNELVTLSGLMKSLSERQDGLVSYARDLQGKATDVKDTSAVFSDKWETNLDSMSAFKDDIQGFLANTYVDGQENGYVFNHFVNPLQTKGEAAFSDEVKKVPPVILFMILLISSLLIGFFSHRFKEGSIGLRIGMTALLSILVGLIISLYSVNMYVLTDNRAIEWTVFTVLLLLAGVAIIRTALDFGQTAGWIASIVLMCLYISPLLILALPDFNIPDLLSAVYTSIKYEPDTLFIVGTVIAGSVVVVMLAVSFFMNKRKVNEQPVVDQAYEA